MLNDEIERKINKKIKLELILQTRKSVWYCGSYCGCGLKKVVL